MQILKKQEAAKQLIKNACIECHGYGCHICAPKLEAINRWSTASIPMLYWDLSSITFLGDNNFKNKVEEYKLKINTLYNFGKSYAFVGGFGVGKTWGATEILKKACAQNYSAKYTTMQECIDTLISREGYLFRKELLEADFICIDEVDSRFLPNSENGKELFATHMENIIRTRFQHKLPIFFCSNNNSLNEIFDGLFGQAFSSLFAENLITIPVGGVDLRKNGHRD